MYVTKMYRPWNDRHVFMFDLDVHTKTRTVIERERRNLDENICIKNYRRIKVVNEKCKFFGVNFDRTISVFVRCHSLPYSRPHTFPVPCNSLDELRHPPPQSIRTTASTCVDDIALWNLTYHRVVR